MATSVIEKRKSQIMCAECDAELAKGDSECSECGSTDLKKSLIIVRKEETVDDGLDNETLEGFAPEDEDESDDGDSSDDEDDTEDDEDDEDEGDEEDAPELTKSDLDGLALDALSVAVNTGEKIAKVFADGITVSSIAKYEDIMTDMNRLMDSAVEKRKSGEVKKADTGSQAEEIRQKVSSIIKATEGGVMPKSTRPSALDSLELPDDVSAYISGLEEGAGIEKSDIFKGLTPEAAEIVKNAQDLVEKNAQREWMEKAESFTHIPGDRAELAKSLRALHSTDTEAYDSLVKSLEAANEAAKSGDITKAIGRPGGGEPTSVIEKRKTKAQKMVEEGLFPTVEQAEVSLLSDNPSEYGQN